VQSKDVPRGPRPVRLPLHTLHTLSGVALVAKEPVRGAFCVRIERDDVRRVRTRVLRLRKFALVVRMPRWGMAGRRLGLQYCVMSL
jgi:hypothetical protein